MFGLLVLNIVHLMGIERQYVDFFKTGSRTEIVYSTLVLFSLTSLILYVELWKKAIRVEIFSDRIAFKFFFLKTKIYYMEEIKTITVERFQRRVFFLPNSYLKISMTDGSIYILSELYIENYREITEIFQEEYAEKILGEIE